MDRDEGRGRGSLVRERGMARKSIAAMAAKRTNRRETLFGHMAYPFRSRGVNGGTDTGLLVDRTDLLPL